MKKIIVCYHGEPDVEGKLSDKGCAQALELARALKPHVDVLRVCMFSSPLRIARETLVYIAAELGNENIGFDHALGVTVDTALGLGYTHDALALASLVESKRSYEVIVLVASSDIKTFIAEYAARYGQELRCSFRRGEAVVIDLVAQTLTHLPQP